ncbi:MAG: lanthionine synthetase LanC family protein [Gemmatimonadales bacterium]
MPAGAEWRTLLRMGAITRRSAIHAGLCAAAAAPFLPRELLAAWRREHARGTSDRPYLDAALRAEQWIRSVAIDTAAGRTWPCTPGDARRGKPELTLYSGTPGVILFHLELHGATGEKRFLDEAVRGAAELATVVPAAGTRVRDAGFYEGVAGHMFTLHAVAKASGRADVLDAAKRAARSLAASADQAPGGGVRWNIVTDIIAGSAGIGLALLAARELLGDEATALARKTGDALLPRAEPMGEGKKRWMMDETFPREMPNFSHGTAGVAYFLATLSAQGGERTHLEAARDGARYLRSIAAPSGNGIVIRHHQGDGANLFYMSWCHGPAGTARLFERLDAIEPAGGWRVTEDECASGTVAQGIPEQRTAGFWNNISQCCGNAGVAEYFLARHARTRKAADLTYARRHADDILMRGTIDTDREQWVQAENRVSPADTAAQTGWMQGAAGVGAMLLRVDAAMRGERRARVVRFPDSPYSA